jgi:hypothetical protein
MTLSVSAINNDVHTAAIVSLLLFTSVNQPGEGRHWNSLLLEEVRQVFIERAKECRDIATRSTRERPQ